MSDHEDVVIEAPEPDQDIEPDEDLEPVQVGPSIAAFIAVDRKQLLADLIAAEDFPTQLTILKTQLLTTDDLERRRKFADFLEELFNDADIKCKVHLFGSSETGLGLRDADLDAIVDLISFAKVKKVNPKDALNELFKLRPLIKSALHLKDLRMIRSNIPIIRFKLGMAFEDNGLDCDLSIGNRAGRFHSKVLKLCSKLEPKFFDLVTLNKFWMRKAGFLGPRRLGNFAAVLMSMFFLQTRGLLPAIKLIRFEPDDVHKDKDQNGSLEEINNELNKLTVSETFVAIEHSKAPTLDELFLEFFIYFDQFDHEQFIVSAYYGKAIDKSGMDRFTFRKSRFCVQDIHDLGHNQSQNMTVSFRTMFKELLASVAAKIKHDREGGELDGHIAHKLLQELITLPVIVIKREKEKSRKNTASSRRRTKSDGHRGSKNNLDVREHDAHLRKSSMAVNGDGLSDCELSPISKDKKPKQNSTNGQRTGKKPRPKSKNSRRLDMNGTGDLPHDDAIVFVVRDKNVDERSPRRRTNSVRGHRTGRGSGREGRQRMYSSSSNPEVIDGQMRKIVNGSDNLNYNGHRRGSAGHGDRNFRNSYRNKSKPAFVEQTGFNQNQGDNGKLFRELYDPERN